jgi:hypothetical protein
MQSDVSRGGRKRKSKKQLGRGRVALDIYTQYQNQIIAYIKYKEAKAKWE